jgi:DNA modification methylase
MIIEGDCIDVMAGLHPVDAIITDPPYNIGAAGKSVHNPWSGYDTTREAWDTFTADEYRQFTSSWLAAAHRVLRPAGALCICVSRHCMFTIGGMLGDEWDVREVITWHKPNAMPNLTRRGLVSSNEYIIWAVKRPSRGYTFNYDEMKAINGGKQMRNLWTLPVTGKREKAHGRHPHQKPLTLTGRLVRMVTHYGDTVLDPFAGSGTTVLDAVMAGRRGIGIERSSEYADIARRRLVAYFGGDNAVSIHGLEEALTEITPSPAGDSDSDI